MSNSSMVSYTRLSPNCSSRNGRAITKITPHHVSGVTSVETLGDIFAPVARQASSNYGIGNDGRVGMYVEEKDRAWTSSSYENDSRAVTIEVSNSSTGGDWPIGDAAWKTLVNLCVDICKRNGIPKLIWTGGPDGTLTMHKMFANTDCPGPYLERRMQELANQVNAILEGTQSAPAMPPATSTSGGTTSSTSGAATGAHTQKGFGGTYRCTVDKLNIRSTPSMGGSVVGSYAKGETVNLDDNYYIADGYVWGTYVSYTGSRRYIAVGKHTGKPENDDYLIKVGTTASAAPAKKSVDEIAKEVINGKWGNGQDRKNRLAAAGYDYNAVQKRVNQMLS